MPVLGKYSLHGGIKGTETHNFSKSMFISYSAERCLTLASRKKNTHQSAINTDMIFKGSHFYGRPSPHSNTFALEAAKATFSNFITMCFPQILA